MCISIFPTNPRFSPRNGSKCLITDGVYDCALPCEIHQAELTMWKTRFSDAARDLAVHKSDIVRGQTRLLFLTFRSWRSVRTCLAPSTFATAVDFKRSSLYIFVFNALSHCLS